MRAPAITYRAAFAPDANSLFAHLVATVAWDTRMRARKTASFGVAYDYSQMTYPETPFPAQIATIVDAIDAALGFRPNNCLLNYYTDGESSMGFHSDTSEELAPNTGVAILSLGAARPIVFRLKADKTVEHTYALESGSLLHMSDAIQREWLHAIPTAPGAGPRISATFRQILK